VDSNPLDTQHIPAASLWEYSRDLTSLPETHSDHLKACDHCISILGLCRISTSLDHLLRRLKDERIPFE